MRVFQHCPLLSSFSATDHMGAFEEFLLYKTRVPVRGAILLNEAMDSVVLVKGWKKGANWSFPRGKINKDEDDLDCAIREVYEETGYEIRAAGLVPENEEVKYIEMEMREQHMRLYVFRNVPTDTHFEPRTRKEISMIQWWKLSDLPAFRKKNKTVPKEAGTPVTMNANKFYMVAPFLRPLKTWIVEQKKKDARRTASGHYLAPNLTVDDTLTEEEPTPREEDTSYDDGGVPSQYFPVENGAKEASADADNMAKTTEALERLLKSQPATQGVQSQMASPMEDSKSKKGLDLLALLLGKSEGTQISDSTLPHTPSGLPLGAAPVPKTPHHEPSAPPEFSSMPPPPFFQIPPAPILYHDQRGDRPNQEVPRFPYEQHTFYTQNHVAESRDHAYQLRHPQPLPPQVQKSIFTNGLGHSSAVAQFQREGPKHPQHFSLAQFSDVYSTTVSEPKKAPKLTDHSLALLNVFKSRGDKEVGPPIPVSSRDLPLRTYSQETIRPSDIKPSLADPDASRGAISPPSGNNFALPSMLSARVPPTEAHKSSLLDIFRQPNATTKIPTSSSSFPVPSVAQSSTTGHAHPLPELILNPLRQQFSVPTENHSPPSTSASAFLCAAQPAIMESKAFTPQSSARSGNPQYRQDRRHMSRNSHANNGARSARNVQSTPPRVFQPQILKRPQQSPVLQNSSPFQPLQKPGSSRGGFEDIFTKPIQPAAMLGNPPMATGQPTQPQALPQPAFPSLREAPRRASQAPISPANQGFLLDYLAGVAKGGDR